MKINRNGQVIELTETEMRIAANEIQDIDDKQAIEDRIETDWEHIDFDKISYAELVAECVDAVHQHRRFGFEPMNGMEDVVFNCAYDHNAWID